MAAKALIISGFVGSHPEKLKNHRNPLNFNLHLYFYFILYLFFVLYSSNWFDASKLFWISNMVIKLTKQPKNTSQIPTTFVFINKIFRLRNQPIGWLAYWLAWPHNDIVLENTQFRFTGFYINVRRIYTGSFFVSPVSPSARQSVTRQSVIPSVFGHWATAVFW